MPQALYLFLDKCLSISTNPNTTGKNTTTNHSTSSTHRPHYSPAWLARYHGFTMVAIQHVADLLAVEVHLVALDLHPSVQPRLRPLNHKVRDADAAGPDFRCVRTPWYLALHPFWIRVRDVLGVCWLHCDVVQAPGSWKFIVM